MHGMIELLEEKRQNRVGYSALIERGRARVTMWEKQLRRCLFSVWGIWLFSDDNVASIYINNSSTYLLMGQLLIEMHSPVHFSTNAIRKL